MSCLEVKNLVAGYGKMKVVEGINVRVDEGKITLLIGPNGAGKSTLAKVVLGLVPIWRGKIILKGERIDNLPTEKIVKKKVAFVPERRHLFWDMSVEENLLIAASLLNSKFYPEDEIKKVYEIFPSLAERSSQIAKTLSGGEQQMLAFARALVSGSEVFILDEPFNGIAAAVVDKLFEVILNLKEKGCAIFLIDQNTEAREVADYIYVMRGGKIVAEGEKDKVFSQENIKRLLLA